MKKVVVKFFAVCLILVFLLSGCGEKTADGKSVAVSINQLKWSVYTTIADGKRQTGFCFENHSSCMIFDVKMTFRPKAGLTEKEKKEFYTTVEKECSKYFSEQIKESETWMNVSFENLLNCDESIQNLICYYGDSSVYSMKKMDMYDFLEPDILSFRYVRRKRIYTCYYDFIKQEYYLDSNTPSANYWSNSNLAKQIPKPNAKVIELYGETNTAFAFYGYGITNEGYELFINECKKRGFTVDLKEESYSYLGEMDFEAKNKDGYTIYATFYKDKNKLIAGIGIE